MTDSQGRFWDTVSAVAAPLSEAQTLIESILPSHTIRGGTVLDAGCGAGDYAAAFVGMGAGHVSGCDVSAGSLAAAGAKSPTAAFALASLTALPYPDDSFDVLWVWGALHYVPDPARALEEIRRVLRPQGVAVIHTLRRSVWVGIENGASAVLSRAPRPLQEGLIRLGAGIIPLVARLVAPRSPKTSKAIQQKLRERFFVPARLTTFTLETLREMAGVGFTVQETHPPVSDLLGRNISITAVMRGTERD